MTIHTTVLCPREVLLHTCKQTPYLNKSFTHLPRMYYGAQEIVLSLPTTTFYNSAQITIQPFFISLLASVVIVPDLVAWGSCLPALKGRGAILNSKWGGDWGKEGRSSQECWLGYLVLFDLSSWLYLSILGKKERSHLSPHSWWNWLDTEGQDDIAKGRGLKELENVSLPSFLPPFLPSFLLPSLIFSYPFFFFFKEG